jgi:hypothetical protein
MVGKKMPNSKRKAERVDETTMKTRSRATSKNKSKQAMPGNLAVARALNTIARALPGANDGLRLSMAKSTNITQGEQAKRSGGGTARSGMALQRARNRANKVTKTERNKMAAKRGGSGSYRPMKKK